MQALRKIEKKWGIARARKGSRVRLFYDGITASKARELEAFGWKLDTIDPCYFFARFTVKEANIGRSAADVVWEEVGTGMEIMTSVTETVCLLRGLQTGKVDMRAGAFEACFGFKKQGSKITCFVVSAAEALGREA